MNQNRFYKLFEPVESDLETVNHYLRKYKEIEGKTSEYLIAITPRSGSSWLTELLAATNMAGNPEEWFNLDNLSGILKKYKSTNVSDYIKSIKADHVTPNYVFGIEASFYQLNLVLEGISFDDLFENVKFVYWTRKDFVGQGISLFKAVETGYFHSVQESKKVGNMDIKYDADKIKKWILHILYQEAHWETFFSARNVTPLRLYYEDLVSDTPGTVKRILSFLGLNSDQVQLPMQTNHQKISNSQNNEIINLASTDMSEFLATCSRLRGTPDIHKVTI